MARRVVSEIIDQFRARFQRQAGADVPLALRQDAPDVVFVSLLEEDKPPKPEDSLLGLEGLSSLPPELPGGDGAGMTLDELLGASQPSLEAPMDPLASMMQAEQSSLEAAPELAALPPEF